MAQNLRAKIPDGDTLIVHDQNSEVIEKFKNEVGIAAAGTGIEVADSPREIAEKSVRTFFPRFRAYSPQTDDEHVPHE